MAKQKNDDMAAALDAMIGGAAEPDDHGIDASQAETPNLPQPSQPTQQARPSAPASSPRIEPTTRPAAPRPAQPGQVSATPPSPTAQQPTQQSSRSARPATPTAPSKARKKVTPPARQPLFMTLGFRQTIIPPLLTGGVLLLIFSALPYVMAADSAFAAIPGPIALLCLILGAVLLATAGLNMMLVRKQLDESV